LLEEELDSLEELKLTHQAMSVVPKGLGVEREMELKFAKRLNSPDVPLEISETHGEKEGVVSYPAPISSRQAVDERVIRNETMKFEAEHEECVRVLPYLNNGEVEIHLYVYGDKRGIPPKLEKAAQAFFGQKGWKLIWADLYNDAFNLLQITSIEYSSREPKRLEASQVDEIEEIIHNHLHVFSKHRNVTAVQPSFKVTKSVQTEEACIVVYVLGKGQIPMGEKAIPHAIGPYRVDIVNGFCVRTKDPYMPKEAHKQKDFLRLGASIGVNGKQSSGTLGAIVEDENSGTLYVLSCDHVVNDADESGIIHPGLDVYLDCLRFNLKGYKDWINRITDVDLQLPPISDDSCEETELQKIFNDLKTKKEMHVDPKGCSNSAMEQIAIFERNLEEALGKRPRVIASYSAGVRCNVRSEMNSREHFIDAAISELNDDEVKNLKAEKFLQIIDTTHYPSGMCIPATTNATMDVEELFKSGSATGFTESNRILGISQRLPTFIKDFRPNGDCAWIDVDCINCKKRRAAQSQVQELPDPCEQCQEDRWLKSCLCIQQHGRKPFSDKGDSGAVIFEKRRKENRNDYQLPSHGFGIIFAELPSQNGNFAIASPLEIALKALSQKVSESRPNGKPCQLRLASSFR